MLFLAFIKESLVVWDAVLAVYEARKDIRLAIVNAEAKFEGDRGAIDMPTEPEK